MTTTKKKTLTAPTAEQTGTAMNEIAVLLSERKMSYTELQKNFNFIISGILLEMELAGLIRENVGRIFEVVEVVEEHTDEPVENIVEEHTDEPVENIVEEHIDEPVDLDNLDRDIDKARETWLAYAEETRKMWFTDKVEFTKMVKVSHSLLGEYKKLLHRKIYQYS